MFNDELEAVKRSLRTIDNVKSWGNVIDGKARANKDVILSGHIEFELMLANAGFPWAEDIFAPLYKLSPFSGANQVDKLLFSNRKTCRFFNSGFDHTKMDRSGRWD